jgi:hypothetical protein
MPDRRLLKSQKNDVFGRIQASGFEPREFEWTEHTLADNTFNRLNHSPSGSWFDFDYVVGRTSAGHWVRFSPAEETKDGSGFPGAWDGALGYFTSWLRFLRRELEAPPLWEQLAAGEPLLEVPTAGGPDSPFTPPEIDAINARLDDVVDYFRRELPPGALQALEANIERLREEAKTSGRITWMQTAIGIAVSLAWGGLMAPEQARLLLDMIGKAFQKAIGG